jgi:hypothetical protein
MDGGHGRRREGKEDEDIRAAARKVTIFGGGAFGTGVWLAVGRVGSTGIVEGGTLTGES